MGCDWFIADMNGLKMNFTIYFMLFLLLVPLPVNSNKYNPTLKNGKFYCLRVLIHKFEATTVCSK